MNWNGGGGTFNTTIGGFMSLLIFGLKLAYFALKLKNFILKEGTKIVMDQELTDYKEMGVVPLNEMKWMPYVEFSNNMPFDEMNQYFTIEFENEKWNPFEDGEKRK